MFPISDQCEMVFQNPENVFRYSKFCAFSYHLTGKTSLGGMHIVAKVAASLPRQRPAVVQFTRTSEDIFPPLDGNDGIKLGELWNK